MATTLSINFAKVQFSKSLLFAALMTLLVDNSTPAEQAHKSTTSPTFMHLESIENRWLRIASR